MILDHIDNWRNYSLGPAWEKAFGFLGTLDPSAPEEETKIEGDRLFARVMSYPTRDETSSNAVLEAHRRYADIQMALIGSERIAWYPTPSLITKVPYDEKKDVQFFDYERAADVQVSMFPGTFVCLFPQDAHMPQLRTSSEVGNVKKVVVKVDLDLLTM
ncbi:MAG: YhcH/YjgK/YiaL family protein [Verrucomicrobiota bacterium]|nr:YhcH/YjgK/YiaL family protein [Verrucomicrobiota bacterium]